MTYKQAEKQARTLARKLGTWVSVVREDGEYETATEYDLCTFFAGADPIVTFGPDGYLA